MKRAKKTTKPDVQALAALAAERTFAALATEYRALGDSSDDHRAELFDAFYPDDTCVEQLDAIYERFGKLKPNDDEREQIARLLWETSQKHVRMGYLFGVEIGKRIGGRSR